MQKTLYILIGIMIMSLVNKTYSQTKSDLITKTELELIEIQYSDSREKTINSLKKIWKCKLPLITKSETNFNGKISYGITIIISEFNAVDKERKDTNIKLTANLIKKHILNYKEFSDLKIITGYITSGGERKISSKIIETNNL